MHGWMDPAGRGPVPRLPRAARLEREGDLDRRGHLLLARLDLDSVKPAAGRLCPGDVPVFRLGEPERASQRRADALGVGPRSALRVTGSLARRFQADGVTGRDLPAGP